MTASRKPVDVLAVMGAASVFVNSDTIPMREARAAVAELIEASEGVNRKGSGGCDWSGHADAFAARERLAAALARVGAA